MFLHNLKDIIIKRLPLELIINLLEGYLDGRTYPIIYEVRNVLEFIH